ncbi:MAG: sulfotransferase [Gammaproteobacteria bacterium]|nr:sulfotransferase [Gammaproteobacteria bacterium]MCP5137974.1 sulfotransferase [Gammaproteobacteria bacterium]
MLNHSAQTYGPLDRALHRLFLGSQLLRRIAFDIEQTIFHPRPPPPIQPPVYIAGLARAGTTILLEALYATEAFTSLTYRNMPLVMAPQLWTRLTAAHHRHAAKKERAHRDRLAVNFDSPEAFEEVFWLTAAEGRYVHADGLIPDPVDADSVADYRRYVAAIRAAAIDPTRRYLAKNNNNILRLEALHAAFPDAIILVPFRNPLDHARSLLRQHRQFTELHAKDRFALDYMRWLGHHEFGADFKPMLLEPAMRPSRADEPLGLDYWLRYWTHLHRHLLDHHRERIVLFDYDAFCAEPAESLTQLAALLKVDAIPLLKFADQVLKPSPYEPADLSAQTRDVHERLRTHSLQGQGRS